MAIILLWNEEEKLQYLDWVNGLPDSIKKLCNEFPGNKVYKIKATGQVAMIHSYHEDGSMTVNIYRKLNTQILFFDRSVFGYTPNDLEECELPAGIKPMTIPEWNEFID